ncbi:Protein chibby 1 [Homalodisca vitripennis]|nr:Protein chibby 1 [Homalodisca vitripennis]
MPLFSSNKFSPKKIPQRKANSFSRQKLVEEEGESRLDIGNVKLNIGEQQFVFEDGEWTPESGVVGDKHKENQRLLQRIKQLESEKNLLQLKTEVLLDMNESATSLTSPTTVWGTSSGSSLWGTTLSCHLKLLSDRNNS